MNNEKIGWGIIGCGVIAPLHADAVQANEQAELVEVCDIVEQKADKLADEHDCSYVTSIEELLANDDIQAVSICTPSGMHSEQAIAAAQSGKHILCEKPLDITLEKIDAMIEAAETNAVKLAGVFQLRTYPSFQKVRQAVRDGKIGKLVLGECHQKWFRAHEYYASGDWRATWELDGGGALMNQCIHSVDLLTWIMGDIARLSSYCRRLVRNVEVEDTSVTNLEFTNGALGSFVGTTSVTPAENRLLEIHGDTGTIKVESERITKWAVEGEEEAIEDEEVQEGTATDPAAVAAAGHIAHVQDLCEAIINDREPTIPGREARKAVEIIKAIYLSSRLGGSTVELPLSYEDDSPGIYPPQTWPEW